MEETEDKVDEESADESDAESDVDASSGERPAKPAGGEEAPEEADVESIEQLLAKKGEGRDDDDDESMLNLRRDERLEPLAVKIVPQQATEFRCKKCFLVKHRSQLKDKRRMLCRDCA